MFILKEKQHYFEVVVPEKLTNSTNRKRTGNIQQQRFTQSLSRTKRNIAEILTYNLEPYHLMITLTYAENYQDYNTSRRDFEYFIKKIGNPPYLRVMELQKRGAIHYHIIIFDNSISEDEVKKAWRYGDIDYQVIYDYNINAIANYLAKYVSDNEKGQLIHTNKKMYSTSRNIKRVDKKRISINELNDLKKNKHITIEKVGYEKLIFDKNIKL